MKLKTYYWLILILVVVLSGWISVHIIRNQSALRPVVEDDKPYLFYVIAFKTGDDFDLYALRTFSNVFDSGTTAESIKQRFGIEAIDAEKTDEYIFTLDQDKVKNIAKDINQRLPSESGMKINIMVTADPKNENTQSVLVYRFTNDVYMYKYNVENNKLKSFQYGELTRRMAFFAIAKGLLVFVFGFIVLRIIFTKIKKVVS